MASSFTFAIEAPPAATIKVSPMGVQNGTKASDVRAAVLGHIKALRSLGRTRINTREIAASLGLPRVMVEQAVRQLGDQGVKVLG